MNYDTAKKIISNIKFGQTRNAARKKMGQGLSVKEIELTADDLIQKFNEQNGLCYWSNINLNESYNKITRHPLAISVDRLDNKRGYIYDNTVLTLRVFNLGKGSYIGDFRYVIDEIKKSWGVNLNE